MRTARGYDGKLRQSEKAVEREKRQDDNDFHNQHLYWPILDLTYTTKRDLVLRS
jgi:hypothetical protein